MASLVPRSHYSKAMSFLESGWIGMQKKASLRSKTEKYLAFPGSWDRKVYGLGIIGWMGTTA